MAGDSLTKRRGWWLASSGGGSVLLPSELGATAFLDRMHQCGQVAQLAAKRRKGTAWLEEVMKKDREVQWLAKVRGGQLVQKGRFLISDYYPSKKEKMKPFLQI